MSSENFFSGIFQPVVLNPATGAITVAAGFKAKFYATGTDIPQTIYTDSALLIPYASPSNIAFLDATGKALIYLGLGGYKLVLTDPNDVPVPGYTIDNITGIGTFGTGFVNSFADLLDVNTDIFSYTFIGGYYAAGDGGEGMFYNQVSATSSDGGYIQDSAYDPTKKWFRVPDENGEVRAASFGYIPQNTGDQTTQLQAADAYANSIGAILSVQSGITNPATVSTTSFSSNFRLEQGAQFKGDSAATLTFTGVISGPAASIFGENITAVLSGKQIAIPEWFGASTSIPDNMAAFTALFASGAGGFKINPGTWVCSALTPPTDKRILSFGLVWDGTNTFIPIGEYYLEVGNALLVDGPISSLGGTGGVTTSGQLYGASLQIVGNVQIGGVIDGPLTITGSATADTLASTGEVTAAGDVVSQGAVVAGNSSGGGVLKARAGTGTARFLASGRLGYIVATTGSIPIPANTLLNNGDALRIVVSSTASVTQIQLKFGTTVISQIALSAATPFIMMVDMIRTGTSTAFCYGTAAGSSGASASLDAITGLDFTALHNISAVVSGGQQQSIIVDFFPVIP